MTALAEAALRFARSQVGVSETPPGSNRGYMIDEYQRHCGLELADGEPGHPWCAAFVSWCVDKGAATVPLIPKFRRSARCFRLVELNRELHLTRAEPGCVFVHLNPNGSGHTGFVVAVEADGTLITLEGNTDKGGSSNGGEVMLRTRPASYSQCFIELR